MSRLSHLFLPTVKEPPADAEAISHKLMVRAGLIRQLGAGLWTYLPAGWRVQRRICAILREEMDAIGAQEMLMPVLQPRSIWERTGRADIPEMFHLEDRAGRPMLLAMTHEENVTTHVGRDIRSYRELPLILYHLQVKARDEPRPRAGVLRTREFIMKDSYSFDCDVEGLERSYALHMSAYDRIFDRVGLEWYRCESDVGIMGGLGAHEYMAPCDAGENEIALAPSGYSANVEVARGTPSAPDLGQAPDADRPFEVATPGMGTIDEVAGYLSVAPSAVAKTLPVIVEGRGMVAVLLRGDHQLNEVKLRNLLGAEFRRAEPDEIEAAFGARPGSIGPVGMDLEVVVDSALAEGRYVVGANRDGHHLAAVVAQRDFNATVGDLRSVEPGDGCPLSGSPIEIRPAIEVGNIFKLGTRYSEALGATHLDAQGREMPIFMGSYGIGPARIAAAAIEQSHDEAGIVWPAALAPFDVHVVCLGKPGSEESSVAESMYEEILGLGLSVLYDDTDSGAGEKFVVAELLGCPVRVTVGRRTLKRKMVEAQVRRGRESKELALEGAAAAVNELWAKL